MGMNWLSQLFWSDPELRLRIHRRAAAILARFPDLEFWYDRALDALEPHLASDLRAGVSLDHLENIRTTRDWRKHDTLSGPARRRVRFLRRAYLSPRARWNSNWRNAPKSQGVIEGAGVYSLRVESHGPCTDGSVLRARYHTSEWSVIGRCENGRFASKSLRVERNDIERPFNGDSMYMTRNSIGAIVIDLDNSMGIPLSSISIDSLQLDRELPVAEDWPLLIDESGPGPLPDGYRFIALQNQVPFEVNPDSGEVQLNSPRPSPYDWMELGPILCWGGDDDGFCHEIARGYPPVSRQADATDRRAGNQAKPLDPGVLRDCRHRTLPVGRWRILKSGSSGPNCRLSFVGGTHIEFGPGVSLTLRGPVDFPENGRIVFDAGKESWGGLVINGGGRPVLVRNARFSRTNEFYQEGQRRTAALTIFNSPQTRVIGNIFAETYGDDAVNVLGGSSLIKGNLFLGTRDAIDVDFGQGHRIEGNLMHRVADDGIDLGNVESAIIVDNAVFGAGDKAVSVGEGSIAVVGSNLFQGGNVGVAVKENSRAVLDGPVILDNRIGISAYKKLDKNAKAPELEGSARLAGNETSIRIDGGLPPTVERASREDARNAALKALKACGTLCVSDEELKKYAR
jgi:hypothetical protein